MASDGHHSTRYALADKVHVDMRFEVSAAVKYAEAAVKGANKFYDGHGEVDLDL